MTKAIVAFILAFAATIVAAKLAFEAATATRSAPVSTPWALDRMEHVAWNGERWTAWVRDGGFELVPEDTSNWSRHFNTSIAFVDWDGEPWQAKISGDEFLFAHRGNWAAGMEAGNAVRYVDWSGRKQLRTVVQLTR